MGAKNLESARRYARQLIQEGALEARVIENATGVVVKKYDSSNVPRLVCKNGVCSLRSKKPTR